MTKILLLLFYSGCKWQENCQRYVFLIFSDFSSLPVMNQICIECFLIALKDIRCWGLYLTFEFLTSWKISNWIWPKPLNQIHDWSHSLSPSVDISFSKRPNCRGTGGEGLTLINPESKKLHSIFYRLSSTHYKHLISRWLSGMGSWNKVAALNVNLSKIANDCESFYSKQCEDALKLVGFLHQHDGDAAAAALIFHICCCCFF